LKREKSSLTLGELVGMANEVFWLLSFFVDKVVPSWPVLFVAGMYVSVFLEEKTREVFQRRPIFETIQQEIIEWARTGTSAI
jgi:hypothetical protein